jgi:proline iminopeptidase
MKTWDEDNQAGRAATLSVPVLIIHGLDDPRPHWAIDSLAAALPDATVVKIPGAGHFPWVDRPQATVDAIRKFL